MSTITILKRIGALALLVTAISACFERGPWSLDTDFSQQLFISRSFGGEEQDPLTKVDRLEIYCSHEIDAPAYWLEQIRELPLVYEAVDKRMIRDLYLYARTSDPHPDPRTADPRAIYFILAFDTDSMKVGRLDYYDYENRPIGVLQPYGVRSIFHAPGITKFLEDHDLHCPLDN
jgi:hypothetical protein